MAMILGIQLEFTHAIGPTPGLYVVDVGADDDPADAAAGAALPHLGDLFGVSRTEGSADVLVITVTEAAPARRSLGQLTGRRRTADVQPGGSRPVSILTATYAFASQPLSDARQAGEAYEHLRADPDEAVPLVEYTLHVVNRAIGAFRVAAQDPYAVEVAPEDPRAVRVLIATADQIRLGEWEQAFTLTGPRRRHLSREARAKSLRPSEAVAQLLAENLESDPVELHLLRAQLDLDHHRIPSALAELHCALQLSRDSQPSAGDDELAQQLAALRTGSTPSPEAIWALLEEIRSCRPGAAVV